MRFNMRIPVLLPAVAFSTHLALEGFHAHVLIHVLLQILRLIEALITAEVWGQNIATTQCAFVKMLLQHFFLYNVHIAKHLSVNWCVTETH